MPAPKPIALQTRHSTKSEKSAKESGEKALRPGRELPREAPAALAGHPVAEKTWRALLREFDSVEGEVVTRLDFGLLVDYCMLTEQVDEIDQMRRASFEAWKRLNTKHEEYLAAENFIDADKLTESIADAFESFNKLDGRADRKRDMLLKLRQALYLTPRARAGAAPDRKAPEEPKDALEQLLDEANEVIHGGQGGA